MKSIRVTCSSCDAALRVPTGAAGQSLPCPHCGAAVTVPATDTEPHPRPAFEVVAPADSEERPAPDAGAAPEPRTQPKSARANRLPAKADGTRPWRLVRMGITLLLAAAALAVLGWVMTLVSSWVFSRAFSFNAEGGFKSPSASTLKVLNIGGLLSLLVGLVGAGLSAVGLILLAFTPRSHAPRPLIHLCIGLAVVTNFSHLALTAWAVQVGTEQVQMMKELSVRTGQTNAEEAKRQTDKALQQLEKHIRLAERVTFWTRIVGLLGSIQAILFPLFLRELSSSLKRPDLMALCETIIKLTVLGIALSWVPYGLLRIGTLTGLLQLVMFAGSLVALGCQVAFAILYVRLREATRPLARGRRRNRDAE